MFEGGQVFYQSLKARVTIWDVPVRLLQIFIHFIAVRQCHSVITWGQISCKFRSFCEGITRLSSLCDYTQFLWLCYIQFLSLCGVCSYPYRLHHFQTPLIYMSHHFVSVSGEMNGQGFTKLRDTLLQRLHHPPGVCLPFSLSLFLSLSLDVSLSHCLRHPPLSNLCELQCLFVCVCVHC